MKSILVLLLSSLCISVQAREIIDTSMDCTMDLVDAYQKVRPIVSPWPSYNYQGGSFVSEYDHGDNGTNSKLTVYSPNGRTVISGSQGRCVPDREKSLSDIETEIKEKLIVEYRKPNISANNKKAIELAARSCGEAFQLTRPASAAPPAPGESEARGGR